MEKAKETPPFAIRGDDARTALKNEPNDKRERNRCNCAPTHADTSKNTFVLLTR